MDAQSPIYNDDQFNLALSNITSNAIFFSVKAT